MLQIRDICKEYRTGSLIQKALDKVSLNLRDNEFVAILGPSGSGKTTLLNIIGGLDRYDSGDLIINGISTRKYKDRDWDSYRNHTIGFVFQSYNLIPHQTILANVELALTISGIGKAERRKRARQALGQVGLGDQAHKKPNQLSGGQMQRVAIARALVNDPDILLADEPTGALDSETSVQVMELLKEVARDRLVVMVTHNPELAQEYATRIVNLKDGRIISDSDEYVLRKEEMKPSRHENMGRASMSFFTALALSFNNLRTKKARTLLTAFAGSIGIIGIALILALSTGVNDYIKDIEEETLSQYPLQIQSTGFDLSSVMISGQAAGGNGQEESGGVRVVEMVTDMFSTMDSNDLESLKKYLDSKESGITEYTNAIEYSYSVVPQIYREDGDTVRQVHPDTSFEAMGLGSSSSTNSMMSSMMSTNVFYEMPENQDLYKGQYDVMAGRWPENHNECVLVLTSGGSMSDFMLYTMGLRDPLELDEMVRQFINEENVDTPEDMGEYSYEDILGITFRLVNSADYYEYDSQYHVWRDKTNDQDYMRQLVKNGEELTIVGIVQPSADANATALNAGICYHASLTKYVAEQAAQEEIVKQQLADSSVNVFTGEVFGEDSGQDDFDIQSLITVDEEKLKDAFGFDSGALNSAGSAIDLSGLIDPGTVQNSLPAMPALSMGDILGDLDITVSPDGFSVLAGSLMEGYQIYAQSHPEADYSGLGEAFQNYLSTPEAQEILKDNINDIIQSGGGNVDDVMITSEQLQKIASELATGYQAYAAAGGGPDPGKMPEYFLTYLDTPDAQQRLSEGLVAAVDMDSLGQQVSQAVESYVQTAMSSYGAEVGKALQAQVSSAAQQMMGQLASAMENAVNVDADAFADAFQMNMTGEELAELMMSMSSGDSSSYENNLRNLGYVDFDVPSGIDIYPKDFESKEQVVNILDGYNSRMEKEGKEEQVITYTDMVGALMSSVTDIIDIISYVLIAFVAISLIVSSIMIGVITYISVLERKKEIGILRAIGASKGNISEVFNAETFIIGLCAGLIGIGLSLLILIPGNMLIHLLAGTDDVSAALPVVPAIILILLSVGLTMIGGIIPSGKAAKSDPVTALRTE